MSKFFQRFTQTVSSAVGSAYGFGVAFALVLLWFATGPLTGFSEGWQLLINTGTTIVTFLLVFIIQHTQNRDSKALHLKLDELILCSAARNEMIDVDRLTDEQLVAIEEQLRKLGRSIKSASVASAT